MKFFDKLAFRKAGYYAAGILLPALFLLWFRLARTNQALMNWLIRHVTTPWKNAVSGALDAIPCSVAELCWAAAVVGAIAFLLRTIWLLVRKPGRGARLLRRAAGLTAALLLIYSGYTLLWGVNYYGDSFSQQAGLTSRGASAEELYTLTCSFIQEANDLAGEMPRNEAGIFTLSTQALFRRSAGLYDGVTAEFPCLTAPERHAKPMYLFPRLLSYMGFTGFIFPFTGEATVNSDTPDCLIPATIAHELSHQRGVADEDEANFVAILACLRGTDSIYRYSGCLLAYIHLSNALYKADIDLWRQAVSTLNDAVSADLNDNNAYWAQLESTKLGASAQKAASSAFTTFASGYGEENVMARYEACVELLVAYYFDQR